MGEYMKKYKIFSLRIWQMVAFFICLICTLMIFIKPKEICLAAKEGLIVCGETVIPSLFPFTVIALFMFESGITFALGKLISPITKPLFKLNRDTASVVLMSFISGYPVGAKLIDGLHEKGYISSSKAEKMLCYSVNGGPAFITLAVGYGFLHSERAGVILLASHIIASLIICFIVARFDCEKEHSDQCPERKGILQAFVDSVAGASSTVFSICSWVILFSVLSQVISILINNENLSAVILSFTEVTAGVEQLAKIGTLPSIAFALGFAGFSVHMQIFSSLKTLRISVAPFLISRFLHGAISAIICSIIIKLFPQAVATVSTASGHVLHTNSGSIPLSFALMLTAAAFMFFYKSDRVK